MRARVGLGLYITGSGFCGPGLVCRLRVWTAGLAQKPGPRGLGLLVCVVKAQARMLGRPGAKILGDFSQTHLVTQFGGPFVPLIFLWGMGWG
jgi:hypothetical protein